MLQTHMSTNGCFHFFLLDKEHMVPYPMEKRSLGFTHIKGPASTPHITNNPNGIGSWQRSCFGKGPHLEELSPLSLKCSYKNHIYHRGQCLSECFSQIFVSGDYGPFDPL